VEPIFRRSDNKRSSVLVWPEVSASGGY